MNTIATRAAAVALTGLLGAGALVGPASTAHASSADSLPRCGNADLRASYHARDAGAGHRYGVIALTNVSDQACVTRGYGGLSYVGHGDGTQIGAAATRTRSRALTVVVEPGRRVRSVVDEAVAQNYPRRRCHPRHVDGFRVYVPDATRSQYVEHPTTGCASSRVHLVSHKAYR